MILKSILVAEDNSSLLIFTAELNVDVPSVV